MQEIQEVMPNCKKVECQHHVQLGALQADAMDVMGQLITYG